MGTKNSAGGYLALNKNTTGLNNTAFGAQALQKNTTGSSNIAVGLTAGSNISTGSNNIDIGNSGAAGDASTIRIGTAQTQTFIKGIRGIFGGQQLDGAHLILQRAVGNGGGSSRLQGRQYPRHGGQTDRLHQLRPVTFHYKADAEKSRQYGLIAEEVAEVYPELVSLGRDGLVETVQYEQLIPMLLNDLQRGSGAKSTTWRPV